MSYHWVNRQELLKKAKDKCHNNDGKEKAAKYYLDNKDVLKEKAKNVYRNVTEERKEIVFKRWVQQIERKIKLSYASY